jgi:hypothetical protein
MPLMSNVRRHMPAYVWSCAACGTSNAANTEACTSCRCPATSTLKQQRAYRAEFEGVGSPVRTPVPQVVSLSVRSALDRIHRTVVLFIVLGALVSLASAAWVHQYWAWSSSKGGVGAVGFISLALVFGPCAKYLTSLRCPRCSDPWLSNAHSNERHGSFMLWALASWRSCASCGLGVEAQVERENDV